MAEPFAFGDYPAGGKVQLVTLQSEELAVNVMSYGASVQDVRLSGHDFPLVLGFSQFDDYLSHSRYFGATVGRCANRIANGTFDLDGKNYRLKKNQSNLHTLHGADALSHKNWELVGNDDKKAQFKTIDADGNCGFPGECEVFATYSIVGKSGLRIEYEATTTKPTPVNIAHHSYFNFNGHGNILDHEIEINADYYLPVDKTLIPTGEIQHVRGTPFDFSKMRKIRDVGGDDFLHDHNFCLNESEDGLANAVKVSSSESGITMSMKTTEPGIQFYTSKKLSTSVVGLNEAFYGPYAGMCLEAQKWPDGINRYNFPEMILRPGEIYHQITEYKFTG